jgi:hypothetical protein
MLKNYARLHEAIKRLIILGHIIWYAIYTNKVLNTDRLDWEEVLMSYLGPPVIILIILNVFFFFYDKRIS